MSSRRNVGIGLLGPVLDGGKGPERWERWRPTIAVCQQEDLVFSRFELLYQAKFTRLFELLAADIRAVSPETEVRGHLIGCEDPWDFEDVYTCLHDFARNYPFDTDEEEYLVHITTGTHVAQICLFLLTESRDLPARLLQTSPPTATNRSPSGSYTV